MRSKDADGIILGNQKLGASVIEQCPKLRLIAKQGSGFDNIDIAAATKRGIPVVISAGINAEAVAEHVMMLMLATSRRLHKYDLAVRGGISRSVRPARNWSCAASCSV